MCGCQWSHCSCGCSYYGDYPETTRAGQRGPTRPEKHPVWAVCRLTVAGLQESLKMFWRVKSSNLSRSCPEDIAEHKTDRLLTIVWLPRSSLGGGLQERHITDSLLPCFHHTSTHLQRKKRQKLEHGAITAHLEDSQHLFKMASGYWGVVQGTRGRAIRVRASGGGGQHKFRRLK